MKYLLGLIWLLCLGSACLPIGGGLPEIERNISIPVFDPFFEEWIVLEPKESAAVCFAFFMDQDDSGKMATTKNGGNLSEFSYTLKLNHSRSTFVMTPIHDLVKDEPILKGSFHFEKDGLFNSHNFLILKDEQGKLIYKLKNLDAYPSHPPCSDGKPKP